MKIDAYNARETTTLVSNAGSRKAKQRIDHLLIQAILGGVLLSFGGLFFLTIGGGGTVLGQHAGPAILKGLQAAVFPIGLVLVVGTGAELFTGNTMFLIVSTLHKKTTWTALGISWMASFAGNLVGCILFEFCFVYYAELLSNEPYRSYAISFTETKIRIPWHALFLRGIAGNWLVCLSLWLATSAREFHSKVIAIYLPIWLFVAVGYEHSIANMFTVQMGMILGANVSIISYLLFILIPVTLGNIVGGAIFVGTTYWYLHLVNGNDHDACAVQETLLHGTTAVSRAVNDTAASSQP